MKNFKAMPKVLEFSNLVFPFFSLLFLLQGKNFEFMSFMVGGLIVAVISAMINFSGFSKYFSVILALAGFVLLFFGIKVLSLIFVGGSFIIELLFGWFLISFGSLIGFISFKMFTETS